MTDQERFTALMEDFGVVLRPSTYTPPTPGMVVLTLDSGGGPKQTGYIMFYADWEFDADGSFIQVVIGE